MNKLLVLLKTSFINSFSLNKIFKKKGDKASFFGAILVGIASIIVFLLFFLYMYIYGEMFKQGGNPQGILLLGITFGSLVIIISSISRANSYLFKSRDFDLLMSLPIETKTIFAGKIIFLLVINYGMFLYFYLPSVIVYSLFNETTFIYWLLSAIGFFFIPILPLSVCSFVSYLLGMIKLNPKIKNIIGTILPLGLMILILTFSMGVSGNEEDPIGFFNSILETFKKVYYPGYLAFLGIQGDLIKFVLFIAIATIPFVLFIWFASFTYMKANGNQNNSVTKEKYIMKEEKISSPLKALILKEVRGYFGLSTYVINTIFGPLLSVIIIFLMLSQMKAEYLQVGEKLIEMKIVLPPLMLMIMIFTLSIVSTTSSSISLEGKSMWILKSLPVREKEVFFAKEIVNLMIAVPAVIINAIILNVYVDVSLVDNIMIILILILSILMISKMGLFINLLFPKFDYDQPIKVIKQGMSVLVMMVFSSLYSIVTIAIGISGYVLGGKIIFGYIAALGFSLIMYLLSILLQKTKGIKKYNEIQC